MMRIMGATGKLSTITAVLPIIEKKIIFNETIEIKREIVRSQNVKSTGLLFLPHAEQKL